MTRRHPEQLRRPVEALAGSSTEDFTAFDWSARWTRRSRTSSWKPRRPDRQAQRRAGRDHLEQEAINRIKSAARRTSQYVERRVRGIPRIASYGNVRLIDAGYKAGSQQT
ncbi:hypothetical protein GS901_05940 [Rhodococcus hoagii]|nr:hypothetical protein [Prescottella equi]